MATITTIVAVPFFAVFIAVVHGDGTCKVAPCKRSFSLFNHNKYYEQLELLALNLSRLSVDASQ